MSVGRSYLTYSRRKSGMDHHRYDWSILYRRPRVEWPGGAKIALWVMPCLHWFPLNASPESGVVPGALDRPYPDYRNYSHRDYGNRIGVFRLMKLFDEIGIKATAAVNAAVCTRYPDLIQHAKKCDWQFIAHGQHMGQIHTAAISREDEALIIDRTLDEIRRVTRETPKGWLSPAHCESPHTLDLLAEKGLEYVCDWVNDDMPYPIRTDGGTLHSMPYAYEISDVAVIWQNHQSSAEYVEQVCDYFDVLLDEANRYGGRILGLALTPWIVGQPHRIAALGRALKHIISRPGVWAATPDAILAEFKSQT